MSGSDSCRRADLLRERETVHLGHLHVEDGDVEQVAAPQAGKRIGGPFLACLGDHSPGGRLAREDLPVGRVVVDDQDTLSFELGLLIVCVGRSWHRCGLRGDDRDVEGRARRRPRSRR